MLDLRLVSPLAKIFPDRAPDSAPVLKKASALRGEKYSFQMAWQCARPNAIVTVVAMYGEAQSLPLPEMYGKNLTFKTGGVDGCDCNEILTLIRDGKINTTPC